MFSIMSSLLNSVFKVIFTKRKNIIFTMLLLKKENEIYRRHLNLQKKRLIFKKSDKFTFVMLNALSKRAIGHLTMVKPETLPNWQHRFIKNFWTYKHNSPGRKPVTRDIKSLILEMMKQDNPLWGCKKIANELRKLNFYIHYTTVNKIIQTFRKQGLIQPNGSWRRFLKMHWDSLFAMDFMAIDTLFGKRFYLLLIMELKTRKIIRFDMTENPCREFVKQRIELFSEEHPGKKTLIYDNASQFTSIDYSWYDIKGVNICTAAPNMNAFVERLNGTIRREALDHFILVSEKQVSRIVSKFVSYYNNQRMHQGIGMIPDAEVEVVKGNIRKLSILSGLHHHYYRLSA